MVILGQLTKSSRSHNYNSPHSLIGYDYFVNPEVIDTEYYDQYTQLGQGHL